MNQLFVTVGATVNFPTLIESILNEECLRSIINQKFDKLVIQFGSNFQDKFIAKLNELNCGKITIDKNNQHVSENIKSELIDDKNWLKYIYSNSLEITGFEFTNNIDPIIEKSKLIISHAGTGSILDTLRKSKPLIVVINDKLMDNHQVQIAQRFEAMEYVLSCYPNSSEIINCLEKINEVKLQTFPQDYNVKFASMLMAKSTC